MQTSSTQMINRSIHMHYDGALLLLHITLHRQLPSSTSCRQPATRPPPTMGTTRTLLLPLQRARLTFTTRRPPSPRQRHRIQRRHITKRRRSLPPPQRLTDRLRRRVRNSPVKLLLTAMHQTPLEDVVEHLRTSPRSVTRPDRDEPDPLTLQIRNQRPRSTGCVQHNRRRVRPPRLL